MNGITEAPSLLADALAEFAVGEAARPNPYQAAILLGLNTTGKHIYAGTADPVRVAKRRAKNKVAKAQRKRNR